MEEQEQMMRELVEALGGKKNIRSKYHCITRLRFTVDKKEKIDMKKIESLKAVQAVKFQGDELQIVVGSDVEKYYQKLVMLLGEGNQVDQKPQKKEYSVKSILNDFMDVLSGVFVPILPAITGAGMIKSLLALLLAFNWINPEQDAYQVINIIADCAFYFLPFMLAVTSARKFKVNEFLGLMIAGSLMYPTILNGALAETSTGLSFLGVTIPLVNYSGSVIPVVLGVYLLSLVYRLIDKWIPKSYSLLVTSTLSLFITIPLVLTFIAPLGFYGGNLLAAFIRWIFAVSGPIAGLVLGATVPLIVMTGMHYAVNPIVLQNLSKLNYDFVAPLFFLSNIAQAGATLGVSVKTKNKSQKKLALSTGISALFGITEPAMYGVNLKEKTPFKLALIASGIGGFLASFLGVKVFSFVMPGLTGLPAYIDNGNNLLIIVGSLLVTFSISFFGTIFFWKSTLVDLEEEQVEKEQAIVNIEAPLSGKIVSLNEVPDAIFKDKIMGEGFAIVPTGSEVYAPVTGKVTMVAETKHAIGLEAENGQEILIHLGIDTVKLDGVGFTIQVQPGEHVKQGKKIATVNWDEIRDKGFSTITPVIFINQVGFSSDKLATWFDKEVTAQEPLIIA